MKKRLVSIFLCTVMTACTLVGCTSKSAMENKDSRKEAAKKDGDYSFAFLTNTLNNTFQSSMNEKFEELCKDEGYEYTCFDPDYDLNTQLSQLSDAANQELNITKIDAHN